MVQLYSFFNLGPRWGLRLEEISEDRSFMSRVHTRGAWGLETDEKSVQRTRNKNFETFCLREIQIFEFGNGILCL